MVLGCQNEPKMGPTEVQNVSQNDPGSAQGRPGASQGRPGGPSESPEAKMTEIVLKIMRENSELAYLTAFLQVPLKIQGCAHSVFAILYSTFSIPYSVFLYTHD